MITVQADPLPTVRLRRVQFDRRELGVELVKDVDAMPIDPGDSLPPDALAAERELLLNGRRWSGGVPMRPRMSAAQQLSQVAAADSLDARAAALRFSASQSLLGIMQQMHCCQAASEHRASSSSKQCSDVVAQNVRALHPVLSADAKVLCNVCQGVFSDPALGQMLARNPSGAQPGRTPGVPFHDQTSRALELQTLAEASPLIPSVPSHWLCCLCTPANQCARHLPT